MKIKQKKDKKSLLRPPRKTKILTPEQVRENMVVTVMTGDKACSIGRPFVVTGISLPFVNIVSLRLTTTREIINLDREKLGRINLRFAKETAYNPYTITNTPMEAWEHAWKKRTVRTKDGRFVKGMF